MLTSRDALQCLEDRLRSEQQTFDARVSEMDRAAQRHAELVSEEEGLLDQLARLHVPNLSPSTLTSGLRELHSQMLSVLDDHRHRKEELRAATEEHRRRVERADEDLRELDERVAALDRERVALAQEVADQLLSDGEYVARSEEREGLIPRARRLERVRNGLIALARSEVPQYQKDRWFTYLRDRRWGSSLYNGGFVARAFDGWLARKIDFEHRDRNYMLLRTGPREIDLQLARTKSRIEVLDNACRAVEKRIEKEKLHETLLSLEVAEERRAATRKTREQARLAYESDAAELRLMEESKGRFHEEAVALHRKALASKGIQEILRIAQQTPTPEDDRVSESLLTVREETKRSELLLTTLSAEADRHRAQIDAFTHLVREAFERFGDHRSRFESDLDLRVLMHGWFDGSFTTGDVIERMQQSHRMAPRWGQIRPLARRAMIREESSIEVSWVHETVTMFTSVEEL